MTNSCLFISKFLNHLKDNEIDLSQVIIQTDNGSEFSGTETKERDRGFKHTVDKVFKSRHRPIPPGCPNANADVETFHALVENEFFDLENFASREDFFGKISTYQFYFNYLRKNSYKGYTPVELIRTALPDFDYNRYLSFPPIDLDELLVKLFLKGYTMSVNIPRIKKR
jgi:transposase InsO family protein